MESLDWFTQKSHAEFWQQVSIIPFVSFIQQWLVELALQYLLYAEIQVLS